MDIARQFSGIMPVKPAMRGSTRTFLSVMTSPCWMGTLAGRSMTFTISVTAPVGSTSAGISTTWSIDSFTSARCGISCFATTTLTRCATLVGFDSDALFVRETKTAAPRNILTIPAIKSHCR